MSPREFGRYKIDEEIGRGAMGVVYRATDPVIGRTVAVKVINSSYLESLGVEQGEYLRRFQREAEVAGRLNHPNIVKVFDLGQDYLVMEFIQGKSLEAVIEEKVKLPLSRMLEIVGQVAEALDYAHSEGVIHRDVKPANIMIQGDGVIKVMDFGLARIESSTLTAVGQVLGSASYMAPEAVLGKSADPRTDIFALGVVSYELMTGTRPFDGSSVSAIIHAIMKDRPQSAHGLNLNVPPEYDAIFSKVLEKDPTGRYQSAGEFVDDLVLKKWADRDLPGASAASPTAATVTGKATLPGGVTMPGGATMLTVNAADLSGPEDDEPRTVVMNRPGAKAAPPAPPAPPEEDESRTVFMKAPATQTPPPAAPEEDEARTVFMKAPATAGPAPAGPPPPAEEDESRTVFMKTPASPSKAAPPPPPEEDSAGTVFMKTAAPAGPPPAAPADDDEPRTVLMKIPAAGGPPPSAPDEEDSAGTVFMKTPAAGGPPSSAPGGDDEPRTVLMKIPAAGGPPPSAPDEEDSAGTVFMKTPAKSAPPSAPEDEDDAKTVFSMKASDATPPPPEEPDQPSTVLMTAPDFARMQKAPAAPRAPQPPPDDDEPPLASLVKEVPPLTPVGPPEAAPPPAPPPPYVSAHDGPPADEGKPPEKKKGPPLGLILGGIAVVLLLVGGVVVAGVLYFLKHRTTAPEPEPAPTTLAAAPSTEVPSPTLVAETPVPSESPEAAASPSPEASPEPSAAPSTASPTPRPVPVVGTVILSSTPSGARFTIGTVKGVTPFRGSVRPGKVVVTVEKDGFKPWSQEVTVRAGASVSLKADLELVPAPTPVAAPTPPPLKAGDLVPLTPEVVAPKRTSGSSPDTPRNHPKINGTVTVVLSFIVNENGTLSDIKVAQSGGDAFDAACLAALKNWKYTGATLHGIPVKVQQQARFLFEFH